jgi:hypothetical protein
MKVAREIGVGSARQYYPEMRELSREKQRTTARWCDLENELDGWREAGQIATLWWRDDDAATADVRLDRLVSIAAYVPISLAVIPAAAGPELAEYLAHPSRSERPAPIGVLQHGWCHVNHAGDGRKSEFPPGRSPHAVISDLAAGQARLKGLFGARALPVLAPPWNRLDPSFLFLLADCGLIGISRIKPRRVVCPVPGVREVNVHVDLVSWAGDRGFIGEAAALGSIVGHLRARRLNKADASEPTGILTHHLVHDEGTEMFLRRLVTVTCTHPAARWLDAASVFPDAARRLQ